MYETIYESFLQMFFLKKKNRVLLHGCDKILKLFSAPMKKQVFEKNLVMYVVNDPNRNFDHVASIIHRSRPLSSFLETRSMLLLEEHQFSNQSSPTVASPLPLPSLSLNKKTTLTPIEVV